MIVNNEKCVGCLACYNVCPNKCINISEDSNGFIIPQIDYNKCLKCGLCKKVCPVLSNKNKKEDLILYACYSKEDAIRLKSSSGGIFSLLAKYVINNSGVVFGASYSEDYKKVEHTYIESEEDIFKLVCSKYSQSFMGDCYLKAKEFLDNGRLVYFSGTPCQIAGLKSFLRKEYKNLFTQDLICHGVPSPMILRKYIEWNEEKYKSKCKTISMRDKTFGWHNFCFKITFDNGKNYCKNCQNDLYLKGFLSNINLREVCYNCEFKSNKSGSDITLADFWGVDKICPKLSNNKGTSLVLTNTEKGNFLFDCIKKEIEYKALNKNEGLSYNNAYYNSVSMPKKRKLFFKSLKKKGIEFSLKKFTKVSFYEKVKCWLKRKGIIS